MDITKTFAAKKGGKNGIIAFEWLADNSRRFVRIQRSLSTVWGVMFLAYAVVRVVVIFSVTISEAVWLTEIPGIIAVAICLTASARAGKQLETLVNDRMEHMPGKACINGSQQRAGLVHDGPLVTAYRADRDR